MDPEYIEKVMLRLTAARDHELLNATSDDAEVIKRQARRKGEIMKWRERG